jgi:16S rRNA (guanine966-N2)-methyltransferase
MRVIAGSHRGRRLSGPRGTSLRPTSDKVREALFSILGTRVTGGRFLDLYAGTGAVGIEALSRGAETVTFVESSLSTVGLLRKNLNTCRLIERAQVWNERTGAFLNRRDWWNGPYHVVFADPPYAAAEEIDVLSGLGQPGLLTHDAVIVIEQASKTELPDTMGGAPLKRRYEYGDTVLNLYQSLDQL